jgi:hypothetical protein
MVLGRELGPHPFASDPQCYRVISTAVWELEQQAKGTPERRIQPIPLRREAAR